eukprot:COSAG04_NODE_2669_length_3757_cov_4.647348_10_plen_81_part_00
MCLLFGTWARTSKQEAATAFCILPIARLKRFSACFMRSASANSSASCRIVSISARAPPTFDEISEWICFCSHQSAELMSA